MNRIKLITRRSNKYIYAQLMDPSTGKTLGSVRAKDPEKAGIEISELGKKLKKTEVIFDRGVHRYHGQVKKLAESARKAGLKF